VRINAEALKKYASSRKTNLIIVIFLATNIDNLGS